jgi:hypothetical protein
MTLEHIKDLMLMGLGSILIYILKGMKDSVDKLNIQIAVVIDRQDNHEKRLDNLENRK